MKHSRLRRVEKRSKRTKQYCAPSWLYLQDYTGVHGQQNIKQQIAQSVRRLATGSRVRSSKPDVGEIFDISPEWPGAHTTVCTVGTGSLCWGLALNTHPHLALRLKKEYKCNSTPSLGFYRQLQGELYFFTFTFTQKNTHV